MRGTIDLTASNPELLQGSIINHPQSPQSLRPSDYLLLAAFCALLFGYVAFSGRPLTLHEARLPQTSREMMARHEWLIPMNGDRPWLERPPFPHWVMIAVADAIGQKCVTEWSVGIPPALAGLAIVFMVAWMTARWFGRDVGVSAGLMLATMYEFYAYSTYAEDDIFLALLVVGAIAVFVRMEFGSTARAWHILGFCILLGLTNLAKGPIVGAAVIIGTLGSYFLLPPRWPRCFRGHVLLWIVGLVLATAIALSWHLYIAHVYPGPGGYWANLKYDFSETHEFDGPWWYYPVNLLGRGLPWTPLAIAGLVISAGPAWRQRDPILRFLWCWAIVPIVVLSLPHRKHHHYLVPSLAPWAILAAYAAKPVAQRMFKDPAWLRRPRFGLLVIAVPLIVVIEILVGFDVLSPNPDPSAQLESAGILIALTILGVWLYYFGLQTKNPKWMLAAIVLGIGGVYSWSQTHLRDDTVADTQFLRDQVEAVVPKDKPLAINAAIGPLDFFRVQFYLRGDAILLHNLTYLRSNKIHAPDIYVVAQPTDLPALQSLGDAQMLSQSTRPLRKGVPVPHLALFHLIFSPDLRRYPPPPVNPMQAMMRQPGPWCGPPF